MTSEKCPHGLVPSGSMLMVNTDESRLGPQLLNNRDKMQRETHQSV
ncbi:MAG: hypothetical protein FWD27_01730 [Coriobacteriia bacterium]|nr:hypothetical protein [Coriobacteriia bacterium]